MATIADLHVHSSLKPLHNSNGDIWRRYGQSAACDQLPDIARSVKEGIYTKSQSNFDACSQADLRLVFLSLYPVEVPFFRTRAIGDLLLSREDKHNIGTCVTGFRKSEVTDYLSKIEHKDPVDYFSELVEEYNFVLSQTGVQGGKEFILAGDVEDVKTTLAKPNAITGVLTVEGMHSLNRLPNFKDLLKKGRFVDKPDSDKYRAYRETFQENIQRMKSWGGGRHAPLFVTFCHHFWNLLCGQSRSFEGTMRIMLNQSRRLCDPMTDLGREVIEMLLDRTNGRRVLIDVKHMSPAGRAELYGKRRLMAMGGDDFPIISSHSAVNDITTLKKLAKGGDRKGELRNSYFNTWSINLCNQDIQEIYASNGLIGILLHKSRLAGKIAREMMERAEGDPNRERDESVRVVMNNMLHIVRVIDDVTAWDHISLGSDYDGIISAFDRYADATKLTVLATDLKQFLHNKFATPEIGFTKAEIERLMFGLTPEQIVDKILFRNALDFLDKFYHESYLKTGFLVQR